jgi:hypothetical protein
MPPGEFPDGFAEASPGRSKLDTNQRFGEPATPGQGAAQDALSASSSPKRTPRSETTA